MSIPPIGEVVIWIEAAINLLLSVATVIYVAIYVLIAVKRAGQAARRRGLLAALAGFLFG